MSSSYIDTYQPTRPPHAAPDASGFIEEVTDRNRWCAGQIAFADWFDAYASGAVLPTATPIDALGRYIGFVHKLEAAPGGTDFRYAIFASRVAQAANIHMQGQWMSSHATPFREIFADHYLELYRAPRLFVGELCYVSGTHKHPVWYRAVAPLGPGPDSVTGFIVLTMPRELAK